MRVQPRQQILDIWRALARYSFHDGTWEWGGRNGRNSISDAEQLLCLMHPATEVRSLKLDRPDDVAEDALTALAGIGDSVEIPRRLIRVLTDYMKTYRDASGAPLFAGGSYFNQDRPDEKVTDEQRALHTVDSFSISLTLTLATLGFVQVFRGQITRADLRAEADELEVLANDRLTAAMIGLLRSFAVNVFEPNSAPGRTLCRTANQANLPEPQIVEDLQLALQEIKAGLRNLSIGSGQVDDGLENPNLLFECGWSWGIVKDAPAIPTGREIGEQPPGVAQNRPSLHFTVNALAGIVDLFSERTRLLRLLDDEQLRLASALQIRWDLTRSYWSTIASFGHRRGGRWPLEDIPWRTSDEEESDYFSLLVTSLVAQDLERRRATDAELSRVYAVLRELAGRARITRRPMVDDPAVELHMPGVPLVLLGSEEVGSAPLIWTVSDFAVMLLKRAVTIAGQARSIDLRGELLTLADETWDHLSRRQLEHGRARGLWDQPGNVFTRTGTHAGTGGREELPSWYFTERVVESLVELTALASSQPLRSERLSHAHDVLSEAESLYDRERAYGSEQAGPAIRADMERIRANLRRAQELVNIQPGTAEARAHEALLLLDRLAVARQDAAGNG